MPPARYRSNPGHIRSKSPKFGHIRAMLAAIGPNLVEFGRIQNRLAPLGPMSAEIGRIRQQNRRIFGPTTAELVCLRSSSAKDVPSLTNIAQTWSNPSHISPKSGQFRPKPANSRRSRPTDDHKTESFLECQRNWTNAKSQHYVSLSPTALQGLVKDGGLRTCGGPILRNRLAFCAPLGKESAQARRGKDEEARRRRAHQKETQEKRHEAKHRREDGGPSA